MTTKSIIYLISIAFLLFLTQPVFASNSDLEIHFFYSRACPFCIRQKAFLDKIKDKYPTVKFNYYLIEDQENTKLLLHFYQKYNIPSFKQGSVPITFINQDYFLGFDSPEGIGKQIEDSIQRQINQKVLLPSEEKKLKFPLIGKLDLEKYSLPALTVIFGFIDGFNVCSLGAILLILGLVLALKSKEKILVLGGIFILTTALIYGLLIIFWHQLFSLLTPWIRIMQLVIGLAAIGEAIYFLKQFFKFKKEGVICPIEKMKIVSKISRWLQESFKKSKNIILLAASVLVFAVIITVVEFPCSAAIPLVFAGTLAKAQLPALLLLFYLLLFLLFYLLDEIIVFLIAVFTMKIWLCSPKFFTWLNLAAAIILFLFGGYYLVGL